MNCKVEYIEQAYRTVHSEFADALTNAHHSIFNRVKQWNNENPKASFTRKESDDSKVRFTFATNGSAAQKKQANFVQQLNRENPSNSDVPVVHSVGRELRVNVLRGTNSYWKKMIEEKQPPSLTTEQTTQIEELKQSDVRWNVSSNFVRNVNELGEQFETSKLTPTIVSESFEEEKGESNTECFL